MAERKDAGDGGGKASWSALWKTEDAWAVWLAFLILAAGLCLFVNEHRDSLAERIGKADAIMREEAQKAPFMTIAFIRARDARKGLIGTNLPVARAIRDLVAGPSAWSGNPLASLYVSQARADAVNAARREDIETARRRAQDALAAAREAESAAAAAGYKDEALNRAAETSIGHWAAARAAAHQASGKARPKNLFTSLPVLLVAFALFFGIGAYFTGRNMPKFFIGFVGLFIMAVLALLLGSQSFLKARGLGAEPCALLLGMLIANTGGTPQWIKPALHADFFLKTGLVLLGAEILWQELAALAAPAILVAWPGLAAVLAATLLFGRKALRLDPARSAVIAAGMAASGPPAAVAAGEAGGAGKEDVALAVGLSAAFTAVLLVALPLFARAAGPAGAAGGAWIGGAVNAVAGVAAAGAVFGDKALHAAALVKFLQSALVGVIARAAAARARDGGARAGWLAGALPAVWRAFPKYILGFLGASLIFSLISASLGPDLRTALLEKGVIDGLEKSVRAWFFVLGFTAIGLSANFKALARALKDRRPLLLCAFSQGLNLALTLLLAWLMFSLRAG